MSHEYTGITLTPTTGWPERYSVGSSGDANRPYVIVTPTFKILQIGTGEDGDTFVDFTFNNLEVARQVAWAHAGHTIPPVTASGEPVS